MIRHPDKARMNSVLTAAFTYALSLWRQYRIRLLVLFAGVLIPLYLFGELADEVVEREIFPFDVPVLLFMQHHATPFMDQAMLAFSRMGSAPSLATVNILIFLIFALRRHWAKAFFWGMAVGGAAILNVAAKHVFLRSRPDLWVSIAPESTYSFPSGHAMQSMAVVAALVVLGWRHRWIGWGIAIGGLFVLLVGLSRIYLGVHYPSDILAGWSASLAWVLGLSVVLHAHLHKPAVRLVHGDIVPEPEK
jgi:membrane-associated phospholipid phosphatase